MWLFFLLSLYDIDLFRASVVCQGAPVRERSLALAVTSCEPIGRVGDRHALGVRLELAKLDKN